MDGKRLDMLVFQDMTHAHGPFPRHWKVWVGSLLFLHSMGDVVNGVQPPDFEVPRVADARFDVVNTPSSQPVPDPKTVAEAAQVSSTVEYRAGRLLAVVGTEHIIEGDILPMIEPMLRKNKDRIPDSEMDNAREQLLRPALAEFITTKCLAQKFIRDMVGAKPVKEYREAAKRIDPKITEGFFSKLVPQLMSDYEVNTPSELDLKLRESGTSLSSQKALFREQALARQCLDHKVPKKPLLQYQDLLGYYEQHGEDWNVPAKARFRQLTIKFANHSSKEEAHDVIAALGNEVLFGGATLEGVIKRKSEGTLKDEGGFHDWTDQGSLKSQVVDQAIFSLPVGRLSEIIEDKDAFHILMVIERSAAYTKTFSDVQLQIRELMGEDYEEKKQKEFIDKAKRETAIWTRWPEDVPGSRPITQLFPE